MGLEGTMAAEVGVGVGMSTAAATGVAIGLTPVLPTEFGVQAGWDADLPVGAVVALRACSVAPEAVGPTVACCLSPLGVGITWAGAVSAGVNSD